MKWNTWIVLFVTVLQFSLMGRFALAGEKKPYFYKAYCDCYSGRQASFFIENVEGGGKKLSDAIGEAETKCKRLAKPQPYTLLHCFWKTYRLTLQQTESE